MFTAFLISHWKGYLNNQQTNVSQFVLDSVFYW